MAKKDRKETPGVVHAARYLVETLEGLGITCILVHDMAEYLLGCMPPPKTVEVIVIPQLQGTLQENTLCSYLVAINPARFCIENKDRSIPTLGYYSHRAKKSQCEFRFISVQNPPPQRYMSPNIDRINGLPVSSLPSIIIDKVRSLLDDDDIKKQNWESPPKSYSNFRRFIFSRLSFVSVDESLREEALAYLTLASVTFAEFSPRLRAWMELCRGSPALSSPDAIVHVNTGDAAASHSRTFSIAKDGANSPANTETPTTTIRLDVAMGSKFPAQTSSSTSAIGTPPQASESTRPSLKTEIVCLVAKKVVDILREIGLDSAIFGSLACYLYGNPRSPNDIDIITFPTPGGFMTAEWLKQAIVNHDSIHFFLEHPKDPQATYRILYFHIDKGLAPSDTFFKNRCKIDILTPGFLHLPSLASNDIKWQGGLPVVPFPVLLLQKLQGWDDHLQMVEPYKYEKHTTDALDVQALLRLEHVISLRYSQPWKDRTFFTEEFYILSIGRVKRFSLAYPTFRNDWLWLGFATW